MTLWVTDTAVEEVRTKKFSYVSCWNTAAVFCFIHSPSHGWSEDKISLLAHPGGLHAGKWKSALVMMFHEKCCLIERSDQYQKKKKKKKWGHLSIICDEILQQHFPLQIFRVWITFLTIGNFFFFFFSQQKHIFLSNSSFKQINFISCSCKSSLFGRIPWYSAYLWCADSK